jgi:hypothetical protein
MIRPRLAALFLGISLVVAAMYPASAAEAVVGNGGFEFIKRFRR